MHFLSTIFTKINHLLKCRFIHHGWVRRMSVRIMVAVVLFGGIGGYSYYSFITKPTKDEGVYYATQEEREDIYTRFIMEAYDSIVLNYWAKLTEADYAKIFQLSLEKVANKEQAQLLLTRAEVASYAHKQIRELPDAQAKKQYVLDVLTVVLYNLQPLGRNGLLSNVQEVALRQNVSNIDTTKNLYQDLGVEKGAPVEKVEQAYKEKESVLAKLPTKEAQEELKKITYAKKVLTDTYAKKMYDETQVEPTIAGDIRGSTLYLSVSKIAPTTLREFGVLVDRASTTPKLDSLLIDFRGNIGGSLDFLQYFLGIFIGRQQFAFDLFHQEEYQVQRTVLEKFEPLARYKEIVILTDNMTQSTAELTAAVFKRLNLATIVGGVTRGWGTVENTFPLKTVLAENETYALFLVHSLTLDDNNQPIEGRGVTPDILTTSYSFKEDIYSRIHNPSLQKAVFEMMSKEPLR